LRLWVTRVESNRCFQFSFCFGLLASLKADKAELVMRASDSGVKADGFL
jgi:hypothetical protein